jgi:hypothetical protein
VAGDLGWSPTSPYFRRPVHGPDAWVAFALGDFVEACFPGPSALSFVLKIMPTDMKRNDQLIDIARVFY